MCVDFPLIEWFESGAPNCRVEWFRRFLECGASHFQAMATGMPDECADYASRLEMTDEIKNGCDGIGRGLSKFPDSSAG